MNYSQGKRDVTKASEQLICCARNKQSDGSRLMKEFEVIKTLYKGRFSKILLVKKTKENSGEKMILKAFRYEEINILDNFERELSTNYTLSPHPNIVTSFNVSFMWEGSFIYVQEYAPFGDLKKYMKKTRGSGNGLRDESIIKLIIKQIGSALEFMHLSFQIVHCNVRPENILVFNMDYTQVKLCDFGNSENEGNYIIKTNYENTCYAPPEIAQILPGEKYYISMKSDAWQLGLLLYYCAIGSLPWNTPDITDSVYSKYYDYHKRKSSKLPEQFKSFTPRLIRLLKRLLEPKLNKRYEVKEVFKYLKDDWLEKTKSTYNNLKIPTRRKSTASPYFERIDSDMIEIVTRPRSVSTSPGIRRSSLTSTTTTSTNNSFIKKSIKSVKFDLPNDKDKDKDDKD